MVVTCCIQQPNMILKISGESIAWLPAPGCGPDSGSMTTLRGCFNNISIVSKQSCQQRRGLSFNFHVSVFSFFLGSAVSLPQRD